MDIPSLKEIEALHRKYASSDEAFQSVFEHCTIVAEIADQVLSKEIPGVERDVVYAGCLLHDIGVYKLYAEGVYESSQYIRHGILGEEILRQEGLHPRLCRFCSHHTGVGIKKVDIIARDLPLPHEDFLADTEEELVVMYADKFHSKSNPPRFNSAESYATYVAKFGEENALKFQEMVKRFGLPDLESLSKKYNNPIV